jgi:hypothetical protein
MTGPQQCSPEAAGTRRRLDCTNARACLTVAIRSGWDAFACGQGCYVEPTGLQRAMDHEGLMFLRLTIEGRCP